MAKPTVAFFGATGGCTIPALAKCVEAGYSVTALVRTPSKLTDMLTARGISQDSISSHLTVYEGNIKDEAAVQKTLINNGRLVDLIVSGVGGVLKVNTLSPTLDDPNVCADAMRTLLAAIPKARQQTNETRKPFIGVISTTGISTHGRDIPIAMVPMYHWLLQVPHADKKVMETQLHDAIDKGAESPIENFIIIRPSFLTNGEGVGTAKLRVGWEDEKETHAEIGYTIAREDVGSWIFEDVIESAEQREKWKGKMVNITQ